MDDVDISRYAAEAFRHMDRAPHASIDQMAEFVSGELTASASIEIESHMKACDSCRRRLEEYEQFVADSSQPAIKDLSREWIRLHRRIQWNKATGTLIRWRTAVAAAVMAAVAGLSWLFLGLLTTSPAQLLARAYQEERPFDIRLAGAKHSDINRQRGGSGSLSSNVAWLKAKARLEEETKSKPDDPEVMRLLGEAEMMSREAAKAVQTLQKARDIKPNDPAILADLGAAYALRGEIEDQYGDYLTAIEYMGQSLHLKPRVAETVFNLALVLERDAQLKDEAKKQWSLYLELDPSSDWAKEARQHLDDLEKLLQSRQEAMHQTLEDPAQFLGRAASGESIDAEAYLRDIVITKWMPLATSDSLARQATAKLAQILKDRHGDTWLDDLINSAPGPQMQAGLQKLAVAWAGNRRADDMRAGLTAAREAQQSFFRSGTLPGEVGARFVETVTLLGLLRHDECLANAESLIRDLDAHPYAWLKGQLEIYAGICLMRLGRLGEAANHLDRAMEISRAAAFGSSGLTASNMHLACVRHIGLRSQFFASAQQSLLAFWNGNYSPKLFHQVADELRDIATRSQQTFAAWFLARGEVWAAKATLDPRIEAPALANLAVAAQAVGETSDARLSLDMSDQLFDQIPSGYRWEPQVSLANVELEQGDLDAALKRLERLRSSGEPPPSVLVGVLFNYALGEANRRMGLPSVAIDAFQKGIDQGMRRVASLSSESEKSGVLETIEKSYRGLVAAKLDGSGDSTDALRTWQRFRALASLNGDGSIGSSNDAVLWFVELPEGFMCWLARRDQIVPHRITASREAIAAVIGRLRDECSNPASPYAAFSEDAHQLYNWMVEPFASQLARGGDTIVFELDGVLRAVPVQVLMTPGGRCLGEDFLVRVVSGDTAAHTEGSLGSTARVLVIANPTIRGASSSRFAPLPDTVGEAEAIRSAFLNTTVLVGDRATVDGLASSLQGADVVHFAGHGYGDSENGELVLAPREPRIRDYDLLRSVDLLRQDWSHCRLAVLSACRAASGEDRETINPDSLVRALTRAGVRSVMASLWNVDSAATADLMKYFYKSLAAGATPGQALRRAQEQVRMSAGRNHPYYWAGFQLYGTT